MFVEDHPKYEDWKARLQALIDAKTAQKEGRASQADVDAARAKYDRIGDEI
jgi:hypothetical protein